MSTQNIKAYVVDNTLHLEVDLKQEFGLSGSGKTIRVATTGRAQSVGKLKDQDGNECGDFNGTYYGLNVYRYADVKV